MTRNAGNWKKERGDQEVPILLDLSFEAGIDELFRPFLNPVAEQTSLPPEQDAPPANVPTEAQTIPGQFEVIVRPFTDFSKPDKAAAMMQPRRKHTVVQPPPQEKMPSRKTVAPIVLPKAVAPVLHPLSHDAREELLELRTEVMHAARTHNVQTLMICGVESGVGASFIAGHLSRLLAEYAQMKVAFLTLVSSPEKKSNRLTRRTVPAQLQFLLRHTELPNLAEIASANGTITLTEMLCNCATAEVLRQMKTEFDLIVIDAPAIATYGEAAMLAALVDGVILVAQPNVTPLRRMDRAHRRLHKARATVLGVVFNRQR